MVDGGAVDWFSAAQIAGACRTHQQCEVCRFRKQFMHWNRCPGQQDRFIGGGLKYPYVEGLRLDEAMHPLTPDDRGCLWQGVTATKWRAGTTDCAVEIWL